MEFPNETREVLVRIGMPDDDGPNVQMLVFTVPRDLTDAEVGRKLEECHDCLCGEDAEDIYGTYGRDGAALSEYAAEKYGWHVTLLEFGVDLMLD